MGVHNNITADTFPKQGWLKGRRCEVCFHYDTSKIVLGTIVRDDAEEPGETIIQLDDGRFVRGTECHYSPKTEREGFSKVGGDCKEKGMKEIISSIRGTSSE